MIYDADPEVLRSTRQIMWHFRKHKNKLDITTIQGPQFDGRLRRKINYNLESWSGLLLNALAHLFEGALRCGGSLFILFSPYLEVHDDGSKGGFPIEKETKIS